MSYFTSIGNTTRSTQVDKYNQPTKKQKLEEGDQNLPHIVDQIPDPEPPPFISILPSEILSQIFFYAPKHLNDLTQMNQRSAKWNLGIIAAFNEANLPASALGLEKIKVFQGFIQRYNVHVKRLDLISFSHKINNALLREFVSLCSNVTYLYVSSDNVDDECVEELNFDNLRNLKILNLSCRKITDSFLDRVAAPYLEELVSSRSLYYSSLETISERFPFLQKLNLKCNFVISDYIFLLGNLSNLQSLTLYNANFIEDTSLSNLFEKFPVLQKLQLECIEMLDAPLKHLASPTLSELILSQVGNISKMTCEGLTNDLSTRLPALRKLYLRGPISDTCLENLASPTLTELSVSSEDITGDRLANFLHERLPALEKLDFDGCYHLQDLHVKLVQSPSLKQLSLRRMFRITGECFTGLATRFPNIKRLIARGCSLKTNYLKLLNSPTLKYLDIGAVKNKECYKKIVRICSSLQEINISYGKLPQEFLSTLDGILQNRFPNNYKIFIQEDLEEEENAEPQKEKKPQPLYGIIPISFMESDRMGEICEQTT